MKTLTLIRIAAFAAALAGSCLAAQTPAASHAEADRLFQEREWAEAARAYGEITKVAPADGRAWYRLGSALGSQGKYREALPAFERAVEILKGPVAMYGLASAHAGAGDAEEALEWLDRAVRAGFKQPRALAAETGFAALRDDPRFKELSDKVSLAATPCLSQPQHREFDYWVGEWDVQVGGQTVGTNVIERLEDGCLIMERWTGRGGSTGRSMNIYVPLLKKWRQIYMSNGQAAWDMSGEYRDGAMRYEGEVIAPNGRTMTRVVLYNLSPDRIRHTQDNSTDGGKTWANVWDSVYVRKQATAQ